MTKIEKREGRAFHWIRRYLNNGGDPNSSKLQRLLRTIYLARRGLGPWGRGAAANPHPDPLTASPQLWQWHLQHYDIQIAGMEKHCRRQAIVDDIEAYCRLSQLPAGAGQHMKHWCQCHGDLDVRVVRHS